VSDQEIYPVSPEWAARAHLDAATYDAAVAQVAADPETYWTKVGNRLDWIEPFTVVKDVSYAKSDFHIRWFADGVLNLSANCLDRHLATRGDQVAIIFEGDEPTDSQSITPTARSTRRSAASPMC
jgi:acetyl-CoA synthetase